MEKIIPLPRCPHSIYAPDENFKQAYTCRSCFPVPPYEFREIIMPKRHVKDDNALFANKHNDGRCPKCNSQIHFEVPGGRWECAEDGTLYKAPKKKQVAEIQVEVAA